MAIHLHHERAGSGPAVLFIGGTGGDLRWKPNVLDGPLIRAFEVLAYDQRGQGRSDKPDERCTLEARADHDTYDRLGAITSPTLVCAGRHDGMAPVANSGALAASIPDARLEVFDGGHQFLLQDRAAWPTIIGFLEGR
jgi:pimeloyl-ACP methyl ester carboxylesterase